MWINFRKLFNFDYGVYLVNKISYDILTKLIFGIRWYLLVKILLMCNSLIYVICTYVRIIAANTIFKLFFMKNTCNEAGDVL